MKSKEEWLVLVDDKDNELGVETRENCHKGSGLRHRAFVVFLFNDNHELLLQRRSMKKLLWPGKWDVSVTSHVYKNENYEEAGVRRTRQELNANVDRLNKLFSFTYFAPYGDYSENEFCVLLEGELDDTVHPNPDEIMEIKYTTVGKLAADVKVDPELFTPWFKIAFEKYQHQPPHTK